MFEAYLLAISGVVLAQSSPGPNFLATVSTGMSQGRRIGFGAVLSVFPWLLIAMKIIGGLYLMYLAYKATRSAIIDNDLTVGKDTKTKGYWQAYRNGLLVIMTNPKAALMWAAVASFLFGYGLNGYEVSGFGPLAAITGFLIYGGYLMLFTSGFAIKAYRRFARWIEAALGVTFAALGASLLLSGLKEIKQ